MLMRMQGGGMYPLRDPLEAYATQDPHGYMCNPWGIPQAACPQQGGFASRVMSKLGGKKNKNSGDTAHDSFGSISTASGGSSWGQASTDDNEDAPINALESTLPHERTTVM